MNPLDSKIPTRRPRLVDGVDVRALPLRPAEAYVLSRIDGSSSAADLAAITGLGEDQIEQALARLEQLGVIRFETLTPVERRSIPTRGPSSGTLPRVRIEEVVRAGEAHPAAALYTADDLNEPVDIDLDRKRRILDTFHRLDELTHYELLGISRNADKRAIKAAYFELVNVFHPDRYYRKNLGSFKPKLERVFSQLTTAHDTLARPESRQEYDAYLAAQDASNDLDRALSDPNIVAIELAKVTEEIEAAAGPAKRSLSPQPAERSLTPGPSAGDAVRAVSAPPGSLPPVDPDARRRALARKLGASMSPERRASSASMPKVDPGAGAERGADELRRRHAELKKAARAEQLKHYLEQADESARMNQPVGVLNSLRIAASLSDDPALAERLKEAERQAYGALAKTYTDLGEYEFKSGRYVEAARSFERALKGHETPHLHLRAAQSLLEAGDNARGAVEHARMTVAIAPDNPLHHVTLGRAYFAAGLKTSAIGALERAAALAPSDATIQDWLRRAKRGEIVDPTRETSGTGKDE